MAPPPPGGAHAAAPPLPGFAPTLAAPAPPPRQQTLDDLGRPLSDVTFVVLDLETTGGSPQHDAITEVGALKLRGGELLGRFETLVNPGVPIPPTITVLTGITEAMVLPAPRIDEVLPSLREFLGDAVIVGHNLRFDLSFLDAAFVARGYSRLGNRHVDTLALARRLVRDEVPNLRLQTLAAHVRASVTPVHRAYADAAATAEVFHALLERAASFGVLGLDDLLALPSIRAHPSAAKLALTARLPRAPGVYLFRDRDGRVLYVGKATNLRARVRSYFAGDDRRKVPQLLRETARIDHRVCAGPFEAAVRELRLIQELQPRFNRHAKAFSKYVYLRLTSERFPRLSVARSVRLDEPDVLGPFPSAHAAHLVREAIETAVPLRRCRERLGRRAEPAPGPPCVPAQLGVATCPCRGHVDDDTYADLVALVRRGLTAQPDVLLRPLAERMRRYARAERFEEAAATRGRLAALARALDQHRRVHALRRVGRLVLDTPEGRVELRHGAPLHPDDDTMLCPPTVRDAGEAVHLVVAKDEIDMLSLVARWLERDAERLRLVHAEGDFASVLPPVPRYEPRRASTRARDRDGATG
jgi:DNA polymerase-3 subunit epsilon